LEAQSINQRENKMKKAIFFLIFSILVFSCKTKDPSLADSVKGTYNLVSTKLKNAKVIGLTGTFTVKAVADDFITITAKLTFDDDTESEEYANLSLQSDGNDIDVYQNNGLVGTFSGNNLLFTVDTDSGLLEFNASK
jgi:hypothetical protein